jgi:hypothetical protein
MALSQMPRSSDTETKAYIDALDKARNENPQVQVEKINLEREQERMARSVEKDRQWSLSPLNPKNLPFANSMRKIKNVINAPTGVASNEALRDLFVAPKAPVVAPQSNTGLPEGFQLAEPDIIPPYLQKFNDIKQRQEAESGNSNNDLLKLYELFQKNNPPVVTNARNPL